MSLRLCRLFAFIALISSTEGWTQGTQLRIVNNLPIAVTNTIVTDIDNYDWDDWNNRPDNNINGISINAGDSFERRLEVNKFASHCPITLELQYADGSNDKIHWNQKAAIGGADLELIHYRLSNDHDITIERQGWKMLVIVIKPRYVIPIEQSVQVNNNINNYNNNNMSVESTTVKPRRGDYELIKKKDPAIINTVNNAYSSGNINSNNHDNTNFNANVNSNDNVNANSNSNDNARTSSNTNHINVEGNANGINTNSSNNTSTYSSSGDNDGTWWKVLSVLITAITVGGGGYWYFKSKKYLIFCSGKARDSHHAQQVQFSMNNPQTSIPIITEVGDENDEHNTQHRALL